MRNYLYRLVGICSIALFLLLGGAQYAAAQSVQGLEIKPAVIEDNIAPGGTYNYTLTVKNVSDLVRTFTLSSQDIKGLDESGTPIFAPAGEATAYELSSWIRINDQSVTLQPGESKQVSFVVHVPGQVSPGSHFGGVFLSSPGDNHGASGAAIGLKIGTIISLRLAGDAVEEAVLRQFSTEKLVYSSPKVNFKVTVENKGNVLVRPHGIIEISNMLGKKVDTVVVNDGGAPVFPTGARVYSTIWNYDGFAFGRYQALISLSYGDSAKKTITTTTSFWVLPLKLIGAIFGSLLGLLLLLYLFVRLMIRRKLRQMGISNSKGSDMYAKKYQGASSRLIIIALSVFLLCIVFLAVLFLMFA